MPISTARPPLPDEVIPPVPASPEVAIAFPPDAPWAQLPGEPDDLHAMFCFYLALGPARSLLLAASEWQRIYGMKRRVRRADGTLGPPTKRSVLESRHKVPNSWDGGANLWRWQERAARYDIYSIRLLIPRTAALIFECVNLYAQQVHATLAEGKLKPRTWKQLSESLETITRFISPETITAAASVHHPSDSGPDNSHILAATQTESKD